MMSQRQQPWFALHVRPRYEQLAAAALRSKGYEEFLPLYSERRIWSDRIKEIRLPLFPGYLFCRIDLDRRLPVLTTSGILSIVGAGRAPLPVPDREVAWVRAIVDSGAVAKPWERLAAGQPVIVEHGPLRGLEGVLVEVRGHAHLIVSVVLLQRSVCVEIERHWARPVDAIRPAETQRFQCGKEHRLSAGRQMEVA